MLKKILSITGRPGLFRIIVNTPKMLLVEDIQTGRRIPASARDRVVSLGDISMYTDADEVPLNEIMEKARVLYDGKPVDVKALKEENRLAEEFGRVLTDFDRDRVHDSDIRKFFTWYNLLLASGITTFLPEQKPAEDATSDQAK